MQHFRDLRQFRSIADQKNELREALKSDFAVDPATSPAVRAEGARVVQRARVESWIENFGASKQSSACGGGTRQAPRSGKLLNGICFIEGGREWEQWALCIGLRPSIFKIWCEYVTASIFVGCFRSCSSDEDKDQAGKMPETPRRWDVCWSLRVWLGFAWLLSFATRLGFMALSYHIGWNTLTMSLERRWTASRWQLTGRQLQFVHRGALSWRMSIAFARRLSSKFKEVNGLLWKRWQQWQRTPRGRRLAMARMVKVKEKMVKAKMASSKMEKERESTRKVPKQSHRIAWGNTLVSSTPDGRELCFAFNAQGCSGKCGRVHACRVKGCYGQHAAREHAKYSKGSDTPAARQQSWNEVAACIVSFLRQATEGWH